MTGCPGIHAHRRGLPTHTTGGSARARGRFQKYRNRTGCLRMPYPLRPPQHILRDDPLLPKSTAELVEARFERYVLLEVEVLLRVANSLTRNQADAEDLVQDTLIRAFRAIDRFDGKHPRAWLLTILRNTHVNRNRRWRADAVHRPTGGSRQARIVTEREPDRRDRRRGDRCRHPSCTQPVGRAVPTSGGTRRCSRSVPCQAASVLGIPVGTVMSRLHRARGRIRDRLDRSARRSAS